MEKDKIIEELNKKIKDLEEENKKLNNRFGLVWKNIPENFIKYVSDTEIVYDKKLYEYICDRKNSNEKSQTLVQFELENEMVKAKKEATSFSFSFKGIDYLTYSNKIYKFKKNVKEDYVTYLKKKGDSFGFGDDKKDLIIEGDNYFALQSFLYTHKNKIDIICIDPPYNTGNKDFKYNDAFLKDEDGDFHSSWLSFMEKRLNIAQKLLKKDGVIFINIDLNEVFNLKILMDSIFGEKNFITSFIWEKTKHSGKQRKNVIQNTEYILVYAKCLSNENYQIKNILIESEQNIFEDAPLYNKSNPEKVLEFKSGAVDFSIPDGYYEKSTDAKFNLLNGVYVENGKNKNNFSIKFPSRWQQSTLNNSIINGSRILIKTAKFSPRVLYGTREIKYNAPKNLLNSDVGTTKSGGSELKNLLGREIFDYPKPTSLIKYLIKLYKNDDLKILDFFAGSGTTGQAVWELNKEDGGNRQFILCTNNENNICEDVTFERLKKANEKYGYNQSLEYLKLQHASISQIQNADKNKNFEYLKELINLKYNSFKIIIDNENFYVNENIAVLKEESKMEEFFEKYKNYKNIAFFGKESDFIKIKNKDFVFINENILEEINKYK